MLTLVPEQHRRYLNEAELAIIEQEQRDLWVLVAVIKSAEWALALLEESE
jgi:hypothetical protein